MKRFIAYGIFMVSIAWVAPVAAYIFSFSNHTYYDIKIGVQLTGINEEFEWENVPAKTTKNFFWTALGHSQSSRNIWKAGFCLQNVRIMTPRFIKEKVVDDEGNSKIIARPELDSSGKQMWNPERNVVVTFIQNEAYNAILAAGNSFADGLTDLAATTASIATGVPMPQFKVSGMTSAIGEWIKYSWCKDRHFDIIEDADLSSPTEKSFKFITEAR